MTIYSSPFTERSAAVPVSEKKKVSNARWDKDNMTTLGCRVRKEQAAAFKEYCAENGKTSNTVLKEYVLDCIEQNGGADDEQP